MERVENSTQTIYFLSGYLDENSVLVPLALSEGKALVLDLNQLHWVNSLGASKWMQWCAPAENRPTSVRYMRPPLVRLAGSFKGFLSPTWIIESFYVPCISQDQNEEEVLFENGKQFTPQEVRLPALLSSESTGQRLTLDVHPQLYFSFLKPHYPGLIIIGV